MITMQIEKKHMKQSLDKLAETIKTKERKEHFLEEMEKFQSMFSRYLRQKAEKRVLTWNKIKTPSKDHLLDYSDLENVTTDRKRIKDLLNGLVVLKLNGGLGTSMGCKGPKSAIEVTDEYSFLDLTVKQILVLNEKYGVNVPLVLMNSFNTSDETKVIIEKYKNQNISIHTFNQKQFPRILKSDFSPIPTTCAKDELDKSEWYPPGHGDIYDSFYSSPLYKELLDQGKKYIFLSNIDNLGATVDVNILNHLQMNNIDFCMEVTRKTRADVKGGTLIDYEGKIKLLEIASVPKDKVEEFKSIKKFKIFNTNNLWINLPAIGTHLKQLEQLDIIVNPKVHNGKQIIQLETAAGASIELFDKAIGITVDRARFLPVKATSDLTLIQSNLYLIEEDGRVIMNPKRIDKMGEASIPLIKLGDAFKDVSEYLDRFSSIPDIIELEHLTISGNVRFGKGVTLKGNVIIVAEEGNRIEIPDGSILENKVITGNLVIHNH